MNFSGKWMMLTTPISLPLSVTYITDTGGIQSLSGVIECFINTENDITETWKSHIKKYTDSLVIINGYSQCMIDHNEISSNKMVIKTDAKIEQVNPMMGYLGSITNLIENSINVEICTMMNNVGNSYSNSFCKFIVNPELTTLVYYDESGMHKRTGVFSYEFTSDYDEKSSYNIEIVETINNILSSFNEKVFYDQNKINKDFFIGGDSTLHIDLNYNDSDSIFSDRIFNDLYAIFTDANISKLNFKNQLTD